MGINLADLKKEISKSGSSKGKFVYLSPDSKIRLRFLTDMEDGTEVKFHDSYDLGVNCPCQELYGRSCPYCESDSYRTRNQYVWSVYDYESKEVKLLMHPVNNCSPVPALASFYESYGTLTDRDYELKKSGKGTSTTYSVVPLDKIKFRNEKVKPFSEQAILKYIDKAYPCDDTKDDTEEEPPKRKKATPKATSDNYEDMKAKDLYSICKEKDIDCEPRKSKEYYIDLLKTAEAEENNDDDWGDDTNSTDDNWD